MRGYTCMYCTTQILTTIASSGSQSTVSDSPCGTIGSGLRQEVRVVWNRDTIACTYMYKTLHIYMYMYIIMHSVYLVDVT